MPKAERERERGEKAHGREMRCDAITIEALIAIYLFSPLIVSISFARARKTLFWLDFSFSRPLLLAIQLHIVRE